ncbi:MAG TPA: hypothetical protein VF017_03040 [Thermoanaerobaculia bacterium]|nr:hypothetical protein [Thermoanaerobaculia bacterium]
MSEPPVPPPPAPTPFQPDKVGAALPPGCGKPVAIGCTLLLVLLAAAVTILVTQQNGILRWTIKAMEAPLVSRADKEVTAEDKARLQAAFAAAGEKAAAGQADLAQLQRLQRRFLDLAGKSTVSRQDVLDLAAMLETFAGQPQPAPEMPPEGGPAGPEEPPVSAPPVSSPTS